MCPHGDKDSEGANPLAFATKKAEEDTFKSVFEIPVSDEIREQIDRMNSITEWDVRQQNSTVNFTQISFLRLDEMLRKKTYGKDKSFLRWKRSPSAQMKGIFNEIDDFKELIKSPINKATFEKDKQKLQDSYRFIIAACNTYTSTHDPGTTEGKIRFEMVEQIREMVKEESLKLDDSADYFKNAELADGNTWADVVRLQRTARYSVRSADMKAEKGGAGTSDVYRLTTEDTVRFYKEKDTCPTADMSALVEELREKDKKTEASTPEERERLAVRERTFDYIARTLQVILHEDKVMFSDRLRNNIAAGDFQRRYLTDASGEQLKGLTRLYDEYDQLAQQGNTFYRDTFVEAFTEYAKRHNLAVTAEMGKISAGSEMSVRNVMTSRVAALLKEPDLVVKSTAAKISVDGRAMDGIVMEEAKGEPILKILKKPEVQGKKVVYSVAAARELSKLQLFDQLCGQIDRHEGNFHATYSVHGNEVVIDHVTGIDNDLSFGTMSYEQTTEGDINRLRPIERKELGDAELKFYVPVMDWEFAQKIMTLSPIDLHFVTLDGLSEKEQAALCDRLEGMKKAIQKAMDEQNAGGRQIFLSNGFEWQAYLNSLEELKPDEQNAVAHNSYLSMECMGKVAGAEQGPGNH